MINLIKNKFFLFLSIILLLIITMSIFNTAQLSLPVYKPISGDTNLDVNGDGITDSLSISLANPQITVNNKNFTISELIKNSSSNKNSSFWPTKLFINKCYKESKPILIIQSNQNNKGNVTVTTWIDNSFNTIYSEQKNIFGILDSNNSRTPKYYALDSSIGNSSVNSFIILDDNYLDITKDADKIPGLNETLSFIELIQANYEPDDLPLIFSDSIPKTELALLWNLDKNNHSYSFQDAFFYDNKINSSGKASSIKWRLTFERYDRGSDDSSKKEKVIYLICSLLDDNTYKISSITQE